MADLSGTLTSGIQNRLLRFLANRALDVVIPGLGAALDMMDVVDAIDVACEVANTMSAADRAEIQDIAKHKPARGTKFTAAAAYKKKIPCRYGRNCHFGAAKCWYKH